MEENDPFEDKNLMKELLPYLSEAGSMLILEKLTEYTEVIFFKKDGKYVYEYFNYGIN